MRAVQRARLPHASSLRKLARARTHTQDTRTAFHMPPKKTGGPVQEVHNSPKPNSLVACSAHVAHTPTCPKVLRSPSPESTDTTCMQGGEHAHEGPRSQPTTIKPSDQAGACDSACRRSTCAVECTTKLWMAERVGGVRTCSLCTTTAAPGPSTGVDEDRVNVPASPSSQLQFCTVRGM